MSNRVLFLDDEQIVLRAFSRALRFYGLEVDVFTNARDALNALNNQRYDLVLLDRRMPGCDGLDLCRQLRQGGVLLPIICFSQYDGEEEELRALEAGADALISKNVGVRLLAERLRAYIRRVSRPAPQQSDTIPCSAPVEVSFETVPKLFIAGCPVELTRIEERVFTRLFASKGALVRLEALREFVWPGRIVLANTVHRHVSSLRTKLLGTGWAIKNHRGAGYSLRDDVADGAKKGTSRRLA